MAGKFWLWSKTAASNATADSTVNWAEGQSPSSVNDSARAMMASVASYRDDLAGTLVLGGTATAYTVTANQAFASTSEMAGQEISFGVTPTNGSSPTLNVNGLGAFPIVSAGTGAPIPAGTLIDGCIYTVIFDGSSCFKLKNFIGNPYNIPLGGGIDYWGGSPPNSSFAFPYGQAISRTTYASLFSLLGTTYGVGDGSTTFNLPDKRGRVSAGVDNMGGSAASRLTAASSMGTGFPGTVGGVETHTLTTGQIPSHTHVNTLTDPGHAHSGGVTAVSNYNSPGGATTVVQSVTTGATGSNTTGVSINNVAAGGGGAHNNVQPTIVCNYIMRVI